MRRRCWKPCCRASAAPGGTDIVQDVFAHDLMLACEACGPAVSACEGTHVLLRIAARTMSEMGSSLPPIHTQLQVRSLRGFLAICYGATGCLSCALSLGSMAEHNLQPVICTMRLVAGCFRHLGFHACLNMKHRHQFSLQIN